MLDKMAKNFIKLDKKDDAGGEKKKRKAVISGSKMTLEQRGVVYLSNVPHGFYEAQMNKFFSQFGKVTNIRLGRSKKTGNFRGYAFVEFRFMEVAKIVAETMNNYLMYEKLMKCKVVPPEEVRPAIFRHRVNPKNPPGKKARQLAKSKVNMERTENQELKRRRVQFGQSAKSRRQASWIWESTFKWTCRTSRGRKRNVASASKPEGRTPVMAIDDSDLDITLKTPPNVRKMKSRQNSAAFPARRFPGN